MPKKTVLTVALATTLAFSGLALSGSGAMAKSTVNGQSYKIFHPGQSLGDTRAAPRHARRNQRARNRHIRNRRRHNKGISTGTAVAIGVGAAALLAIAASSNSKKHIITKRRAINRCLDRADRRTLNRGGNGVVLRRVNRIRLKNGDWRVSLRIRQIMGGGRGRIRNPSCRIRGNRVIKFSMR